uniref:Retroviral polymerase SH3-like domain-containing protein n=1 Tax=Lactuca sativa TaxID=4236 RepID=A0A9R1ULG2_LACSA|nr:hypothetical protein LSAT_V11C800418380 [Lactuca sativa]
MESVGCVAYYCMPDPKQSKLGVGAIKSIFIGYAQNNKSYQLLDDESGVVVESRDVEFFEDRFSRDDENSNNTKPTSASRKILPPSPITKEPRTSTRARIEKSINFTEPMTSRDAPLWKEAINDEIDSTIGNGT